MPNEQLRQALLDADLEIEDLAVQLGVDTKTAQRWLSGRTPYPRYRHKISRILNTPIDLIWPDTAPRIDRPTSPAPAGPADEYGLAQDPTAGDWIGLLAVATDRIDLLDYTLAEVLHEPGVIDQLSAKADAGCQIRILVASPRSEVVRQADEELDQPDRSDDADDLGVPTILQNDAAVARELLWPLEGHPRIEIRQHTAHRQNSILRFDTNMIVLLHLYATRTADAPKLALSHGDDDGLFERFDEHFQNVWDTARDFRDRLIPTLGPGDRDTC